MRVVKSTHLGVSKSKPRFWVEGKYLSTIGIQPDWFYQATPDEDKKELYFYFSTTKSDGGLKVKARKPKSDDTGVLKLIIDYRDDVLDELFGDAKLRVVVTKKFIKVTLHDVEKRRLKREARFKAKAKSGEPFLAYSMYHGSGVFDKAVHEGLRLSGISAVVRLACDMEQKYLENSMRVNPELFDEESVFVNMKDSMMNYQLGSLPEFDIGMGGLSCVGTANQGRTKKENKIPELDPNAGANFHYFMNAQMAFNPAIIIIEQVKNFQRDIGMGVIRNVLAEQGYVIVEDVINGLDHSCFESRNRFVCVAYSKGLDIGDVVAAIEPEPRTGTIEDILEDIGPDDPRWRSFDYLYEKEMRDMEKGNGFKQHLVTPDDNQLSCIGSGYTKGRSSESRLLHPTIDGLSRLFTPIELARARKHPECIYRGLPDTLAHEIGGQSISYLVFLKLGKALGDAITRLAKEDIDDTSQPIIIAA